MGKVLAVPLGLVVGLLAAYALAEVIAQVARMW